MQSKTRFEARGNVARRWHKRGWLKPLDVEKTLEELNSPMSIWDWIMYWLEAIEVQIEFIRLKLKRR